MKKTIVILLIFAMAAMVGCAGGSDKTNAVSPYKGGSQGLMVTFEPLGVVENGIATIFEDETFPVEITLKNNGEDDIAASAVKIKLKGISPNDYDGIAFEKTNSNVLDRISDSNPQGGEETVDFGDAKYKIPMSGSYYDVTVFVSYQYPYKTHVAVPKMCFSTDLKDKTVCTIEEVKPAFASGAPVQVTAARETRAGSNLIAVEFDVSNVGGGEVTKPGVEFDTRYGQIAFSVDDTSNPSAWECRLGGEENGGRLIDGKGTIRCKQKTPMTEGTMYTKQFDLTVSYDYKGLIEQSIRIKKKD
ncbi:MAG: hypothetical protein NT001_00735 [Candidatus Woesearchaeota archaeon]|nr:hypothetical protein [Candidatus Woesearchaeota archaeon]